MAVDIPIEGGNMQLRYVPWGWKLGLWAALTALLSLTGWVVRNTLSLKYEKMDSGQQTVDS